MPVDKKTNGYVKYSTLAIQLVAIVFGLTFLGHFIDGEFEIRFPLFTVVLSLLSVVAVVYYLIKSIK